MFITMCIQRLILLPTAVLLFLVTCIVELTVFSSNHPQTIPMFPHSQTTSFLLSLSAGLNNLLGESIHVHGQGCNSTILLQFVYLQTLAHCVKFPGKAQNAGGRLSAMPIVFRTMQPARPEIQQHFVDQVQRPTAPLTQSALSCRCVLSTRYDLTQNLTL